MLECSVAPGTRSASTTTTTPTTVSPNLVQRDLKSCLLRCVRPEINVTVGLRFLSLTPFFQPQKRTETCFWSVLNSRRGSCLHPFGNPPRTIRSGLDLVFNPPDPTDVLVDWC